MTRRLLRDVTCPTPKWWLRLPWGHWAYLTYRPPERAVALGAWLLVSPPTASLSAAVGFISFVVGYRWRDDVKVVPMPPGVVPQ